MSVTTLDSFSDGGFDVAVRRGPGYDVVTARGDLDAASARDLRAAVTDPELCSQDRVVLDLTGLGFLDSIGVSVLVMVRRLTGSPSKHLVLVCGEGPVLRVLRLVGLHEVLSVHATLDDALAALGVSGSPDA